MDNILPEARVAVNQEAGEPGGVSPRRKARETFTPHE